MTTVLSRSSIWRDVELDVHSLRYAQRLQRLVMRDSLFRVYVAVDGLTFCRMLLLEIPEDQLRLFERFNELEGLMVKSEKNGQEKKGCATCVIGASESSENDIFSIVADDILLSLSGVIIENVYAETICQRLDKWKEFFKNRKKNLLSDDQIIGLLGELEFLKALLERGISTAFGMWNGPLETAQDFQCEKVAVEIKTTRAAEPDYVTISSLAQLNIENREHLFLVVYKFEKIEGSGVTLPEKIAQVITLLTPVEQILFSAKLLCMGYCDESSHLYRTRYAYRNCWYYTVEGSFPRITKEDVPSGIFACTYRLHLDVCAPFITDIDTIISTMEDNHV